MDVPGEISARHDLQLYNVNDTIKNVHIKKGHHIYENTIIYTKQRLSIYIKMD